MTSSGNGGFLLCGAWTDTSGAALLRIDAQGEELWQRHLYSEYGYRGTASAVARLRDRGFVVAGFFTSPELGAGYRPSLCRITESGIFRWGSSYAIDLEDPFELGTNEFNSIVINQNNEIVATGTALVDHGDTADYDGLLMILEPDQLGPIIIHSNPLDTAFTVLRNERIEFKVIARSPYFEHLHYYWTCNDSVEGIEIHNDTLASIFFERTGEFSIRCVVSDEDAEKIIRWHISIRDLYVASSSPDTFSLALRRGTTQTFSLDTVRAVEGDVVQYQWTLTNLDNFEREDAGADTGVTMDFLRSGNFQMEGMVYRGESSDNVIWTIAVRSAILDFWPREFNLSVPPDSLVNFGVLPFNPESDSLSYAWFLDGELIGQDSAVGWWFAPKDSGQIGNLSYQVGAIVLDGSEGDTVEWTVSVREPDAVGKWASGQVDKWGLLSVSPNPFNSTTTIRFTVPSASPSTSASLTIHDLTGREVQRLVDDRLASGDHSLSLNGSNLPPGLYFLRLEAAGRISTQKLVLMK